MVKSGEFEVLERRQGINMRVNRKTRGDCFGEVSLMYSCPRSATVAATTPAVVWVLERQIFRCSSQCSLCMHAPSMKHIFQITHMPMLVLNASARCHSTQ